MINKLLNYGDDFNIENVEKIDNKNIIYLKSNTTSCKCPKCNIVSEKKTFNLF